MGHRAPSGWFAIALTVLAVLGGLARPALAHAARVVVLEPDGRAVVHEDPYLRSTTTPRPAVAAAEGRASARAQARDRTGARARDHAHIADDPVFAALAELRDARAISAGAYESSVGTFTAALHTLSGLSGTRAAELGAVIANLENMAAGGMLTPSRLRVLFLTLRRNRQWWSTGPLLSDGQYVQFAGSRLVWEYYASQGIELQELASFSAADALCTAGRRHRSACAALLAELIPLGANRAGRLTWEYYFDFDGGVPPWTSAMSQGTALQAFADGYRVTRHARYLSVGRRALAEFSAAPPDGVAVSTGIGARYVQYTFDPARSDEVINGFLQALIGLDDFAQTSKSRLARRLFAAGSREAQAELPQFDTGTWSLYQPGQLDDLSYHELVTGFLQQLCAMTKARVYCTTARHFARYLKSPPPGVAKDAVDGASAGDRAARRTRPGRQLPPGRMTVHVAP